MHTLAQAQAQGAVVAAGEGIGQHLQLLGVTNQPRRVVQVAAGNIAAFQQAFDGHTLLAEHLGGQGNGVQGGENALLR